MKLTLSTLEGKRISQTIWLQDNSDTTVFRIILECGRSFVVEASLADIQTSDPIGQMTFW